MPAELCPACAAAAERAAGAPVLLCAQCRPPDPPAYLVEQQAALLSKIARLLEACRCTCGAVPDDDTREAMRAQLGAPVGRGAHPERSLAEYVTEAAWMCVDCYARRAAGGPPN
jgi:hypothetical protein